MYYLTTKNDDLENEISDFAYEHLPRHKKLQYRKKNEDSSSYNSETLNDTTNPAYYGNTETSPLPDSAPQSNDYGGGSFGGGGASGGWDSSSSSSDSGSSSSDGGGGSSD